MTKTSIRAQCTARNGWRIGMACALALGWAACGEAPSVPIDPTPTDTVPADTTPTADLGSWSTGPVLPERIQEFHAVVLNGSLYVAGGIDANDAPTVHAYRLDLDTRQWEQIADLPRGRHHMPLVTVGDSIYAVGGISSPTDWDVDANPWVPFRPSLNLWMYHEAAGEWVERASLPYARASAAVAVVDGKIYVAGGQDSYIETIEDYLDPSNLADSLLIYDPAIDAWSTGEPIPDPRDHLSGASLGGLFYAIGGRDLLLQEVTRRVDVYDPATGTWSRAPGLRVARGGFTAQVLDGGIHVYGGEIAERALDEHERYDPDTGEWTFLSPLPVGVHGNAGAVWDGLLYSLGGGPSPGFSQINGVRIFTPPAGGF